MAETFKTFHTLAAGDGTQAGELPVWIGGDAGDAFKFAYTPFWTTTLAFTSAADWRTGLGGIVTGPASAANSNLPAFNDTTGKVLKDSGVALANLALLSGAQTFTGGKTFSSSIASTLAGSASVSPFSMTGALLTGGSGTTNVPHLYLNPGSNTAPTSWSTSGVLLGMNAPSGFAGNFMELYVNGGSNLFKIGPAGGITTSGAIVCGNVSAGTGAFLTALNVTATGTNANIRAISTASNNPALSFYDTADGGFQFFSHAGGFNLCSLNTAGSFVSNLMTMNSTGQTNFLGAAGANASSVGLQGAPYTAGTATSNIPQLYINQSGNTSPTTWSATGTLMGANAPSGFTGNFLDFHLNGGSSLFAVNTNGTVVGAGSLSMTSNVTGGGTVQSGSASPFRLGARTQLSSAADGNLTLYNTAASDFGLLKFGGETASFPALKRSSALLLARLADDSAYCGFLCAAITAAGTILPGTDNTFNLGSGSFRFGTVFAGTGTINTSDANTKVGVRALQKTEIAVAKRLAAGIQIFQFCDAVAAKGEKAARLHIGLVAQDVLAAFEAEGLDARRYGMFCEDQVMKVDPDGDGQELIPDGDKKVLGLRYDEVAQFIMAGMAARLALLEAA